MSINVFARPSASSNDFMKLASMFILKPYVGSDSLVSGFSAPLLDYSVVLTENIVTNASCLWAR